MKQISNHEFRAAIAGYHDMAGFPFAIAQQVLMARRRIARQWVRAQKREAKAQEYAAAGLNGKRAVLRRRRAMGLERCCQVS